MMIRLWHFAMFAVATLLMATVACTQSATATDQQDSPDSRTDHKQAERIEELIRGLDSDKFKVRQRSEKELRLLGIEVIKPLEEAAKSGPAEVRYRAERILEQIRPQLLRKQFATFRGPVISRKNAAKLRMVAELRDDVRMIRWRPDGKRVAFVRWEQPVDILNGSDFRLLQEFTTKRGPIHFSFSPKPDIIAYCDNTTVARIQDLTTGKSIELPVGSHQPCQAFSPDGKLVATGGYGSLAKLWRVSDGQLLAELDTGSKKGGLRPVFSPDDKLIAVGHRNSTTTIFDVANGERVDVVPKRMTQELAFSPDGKTLALTYVDGSIGLWSVADHQLSLLKRTDAEELYTVAWSPKGDLIATAGLQGKITIWNPQDLSVVRELDGPDWVICVRFTPDGTRLVTAGGFQVKADMQETTRKVQMWGIPVVER